jgi:hypothetical protein
MREINVIKNRQWMYLYIFLSTACNEVLSDIDEKTLLKYLK